MVGLPSRPRPQLDFGFGLVKMSLFYTPQLYSFYTPLAVTSRKHYCLHGGRKAEVRVWHFWGSDVS